MHAEYLLFNVFVFLAPIIGYFLVGRRMRFPHLKPLLMTLLLAGGVFIGWDMLVVGKWWNFSEMYTLGVRISGLPSEEWLFFFSVGFGMLTLWVNIPDKNHRFVMPLWRLALVVLAILGGYALMLGMEYTGVTLVLMAIAGGWLHRSGLVFRQRFWILVGLMVVLTTLFNTYLTARPVVTYSSEHKSSLLVGTIPIEDYGFGLLYLFLLVYVYEKFEQGTRTETSTT